MCRIGSILGSRINNVVFFYSFSGLIVLPLYSGLSRADQVSDVTKVSYSEGLKGLIGGHFT